MWDHWRRADLAAIWQDLADRALERGDYRLAQQRQINADYHRILAR